MPDDPRPCAHTAYPEGRADERTDLPATGEEAEDVEAAVWAALSSVEDPEMPVSVVDLGLIYGVHVEAGRAAVEMTLTYTGCPARRLLLDEVEAAAARPDGIDEATVSLVWSPPWSVDLVTDRGRERLREFGLSV